MSDTRPENMETEIGPAVPHSGKYADAPETPVQEFDKTNLSEAVERNLLDKPKELEPEADLPPDHPENIPPTPTPEKQRKWLKPVAAVLGIGALGAGAYAAGSSQGTEESGQLTTQTSATPVAPSTDPVQPMTPPSTETTVTTQVENGANVAPEVIVDEAFMPFYMTEFSKEGAQNLYSTLAAILSFNRADLLDSVVVNPTSEVGNELQANAATMAGHIATTPRWQRDIENRSWIRVESFIPTRLLETGERCAEIQLRRKFFSNETIELHEVCFAEVARERLSNSGEVEDVNAFVIGYITRQEIISE